MKTSNSLIPPLSPAILVEVVIEIVNVGRSMKALVDTGAELTAVRRSDLPDQFKMDPWKEPPFRCADDSPLTPLGLAACTVRCGLNVVELCRVAVLESSPYAAILGMDWLLASGASLVPRRGRMVLSWKDVEESRPNERVEPAGERIDGGTSREAEELGAAIGRLGVEVGGGTILDELGDPFAEFSHLLGNHEPEPDIPTNNGPPEDVQTGGSPCHFVGGGQRYRLLLKEDTILGPSQSRFVKIEADGLDRCGLMLEGKFVSNPGKEWVAPRCLVNVKKGTCETLITNLSSRPIILRKSKIKFHAISVKASKERDQLETLWEVEENALQNNSNDTSGRSFCLLSQSSPFKLGEGLSERERIRLLDLLHEYEYCFHPAQLKAEKANGFKHPIDTGQSLPIRTNPRRVAPAEKAIIREQVADMLSSNVIEPSCSPWSSPVILVRKKDNSVRFCIDYRKLNKITIKDVYPLPRVDDVLDRLAGSSFFSIIDLYKGYWQLPVRESDREKTACFTPDGLFQFRQMPFGLTNAHASFQRLMDTVPYRSSNGSHVSFTWTT